MNTEKKGLNISVKSFITAIAVIWVLMILTYILTFVIPGGEYSRVVDDGGNLVIDTAAEFLKVEGGIPFWKWILSPFLVLTADGNVALIAVIVFLLIIGGVFNSLDHCGLMKYMLDKISFHYGERRYALMAAVTLFFMSMGAFIGSFEECVPLVPIVVALSLRLGWDVFTGLGMSLLASGCGFASGVCNPFTVGVAQELAGLPMFSGMWFRGMSFILIYAILLAFLLLHAKKVEQESQKVSLKEDFVRNSSMDKALICFVVIVGIGILLVLSSAVITVLQDYTIIIVALMFLIAGISSVLLSGMKGKELGSSFAAGVVSIFPAVLMILMANSIKYTLVESHILDTILHEAVAVAESLPGWLVVLFVYLIVLFMNFFIPSGSAKAFLLIPLIAPLAQLFGVSAQLCIVAFAFGDGFSNVFYPTNPVLLISLGLADVDYVSWIKWSWKFQLLNLILTSGILLVGFLMGYC